MNYESAVLPPDELVDSTYQAAIDVNRVKALVGAIEPEVAKVTEQRIEEARVAMARIRAIVDGDPAVRETRLEAYRHEVDRLNESTVCEKSELEWPRQASLYHVLNVISLWFVENVALLFGIKPKDRAAVKRRAARRSEV
jgi:hypothetical protein